MTINRRSQRGKLYHITDESNPSIVETGSDSGSAQNRIPMTIILMR